MLNVYHELFRNTSELVMYGSSTMLKLVKVRGGMSSFENHNVYIVECLFFSVTPSPGGHLWLLSVSPLLSMIIPLLMFLCFAVISEKYY